MRTSFESKENKLNTLSGKIISSAMEVHSVLGPGLLESTYEKCLIHELESRSVKVTSQVLMPITYKGISLDAGYRVDLVVENSIIVELKAVESFTRNHTAQILAYLKLSQLKLGLLINFNVPHLKQGIKRIVNNF
jgi:GxxExxY protein